MSASATEKLPLPPGPRGLFRNLYHRFFNFPSFLEGLCAEYGDIVRFDVPALRNCAIFEPDLAREVLTQEDVFPPWDTGTAGILESCMIMTQHDEHEQRKQHMQSALAKGHEGYIGDVISRAVDKRCAGWRPDRTIDIKEEFEQIVAQVLMDIVVGPDVQIDTSHQRVVLAYVRSSLPLIVLPGGLLWTKLPLPHNRRARRSVKALDLGIYEAIRLSRDPRHRADGIVPYLAKAGRRGIDERSYTDREIRDEAIALLYAFSDNPVTSLTCGVHYLSDHPDARSRLRSELDDVLGDSPVRAADLARLPYTRAVFREVLRLTSPAYILLPRMTQEDTALGGYRIPKGTLVNVAAQVQHRRADHWPRADEFRPERWLEEEVPVRSGCPAHTYIPFGIGHRICPWRETVEMLFVITHAHLLRNFHIEPESSRHPKVISFGLGLKGPYNAKAARRQPAAN